MRVHVAAGVLVVLGACSSGGGSEPAHPGFCAEAERMADGGGSGPDPAFGTVYSTEQVTGILSSELAHLRLMQTGAPAELRSDLEELTSLYEEAFDAMRAVATAVDSGERGEAQGALAERVGSHRHEYQRLFERVSRRVDGACEVTLPGLALLRVADAAAEYMPSTIEGQLQALACRGQTEVGVYRLPPAWNTHVLHVTAGFELVAQVDPDCEGLQVLGRLSMGSAPRQGEFIPAWFLVDVQSPEPVRGWAWLAAACGSGEPGEDFRVCEVMGSAVFDDNAANRAVEEALKELPVPELVPIAQGGVPDLVLAGGPGADLSGAPCSDEGSLGGGGGGFVELHNGGTGATPRTIEVRTSEGVQVLELHRGIEPGERVSLYGMSGQVQADPNNKIRESDESNNEAVGVAGDLYICR